VVANNNETEGLWCIVVGYRRGSSSDSELVSLTIVGLMQRVNGRGR